MRHPTVGARHARRGRRRRRRGSDADPEFRPCFHRRLRVERPSRHDRRRRPSRSISARVRTPPPARAHARHRETNNNNPTPLPPSRAHRPRLIARRVQLARPRGVSREAFKPAQAIQPAGALSNLPARATSPPRTRPVPPGLSLTKDPIPPRAGLGRVGRVRERGRIRGDLRRVQRDQHGGRRRQSRRATASLTRGSRASQGPPGEPRRDGFDTSKRTRPDRFFHPPSSRG